MLAALLLPLVAVILGTSLALVGGTADRVLLPIRTFALAAVVVAVSLHLVPEAIASSGGWVLIAFAAGLWLPHLLARRSGSAGEHRHRHLASELGFLMVLMHQVGDGVALGAATTGAHAGHTHWDLLLGVLAHTIPLAAVVTLPFVPRGAKHLAWRASLLIAASALGVLATEWLASVYGEALPWLSAGVAGTLLHLLSHDEPSLARPARWRAFEVGALLFGLGVPIALASDHERPVLAAFAALATSLAPPLLVGLVGAVLLRRRPAVVASRRAPILAAWLSAIRAPSCACEVAEQASPRAGAPDTRTLTFLLAAPELHVGTIALTAWLFGPIWAALRAGLALAATWLAASLAGARREATETAEDHDAARPWPEHVAETLVHAGPWLAAGLVVASWLVAAVPAGWRVEAGALGSGWIGVSLVIAALTTITYVCAWASTPAAAVLVGYGVPPALVIAGLVIGSLTNRAVLVVVWRSLGRRAVAAIAFVVIAIALAAALVVPHAPSHAPVPAAPRWLELSALAVLAAATLFSLWRHGLTAWLEPLLSSASRHHQHDESEPCRAGCHDPHAAQAPSADGDAHDAHDHAHDHDHLPHAAHGHDRPHAGATAPTVTEP